MGCGGSKPVQQQSIELDTRTQTRQKTAIHPSGAGTTRPHTSNRQPSGHRQSRSGRPSSSRNLSSNTRHREANPPHNRLAPLAEQPEDVAISNAVRDLAAIIEGHSRNYYPKTHAFAAGKEIGQIIVNDAIMGDDNKVVQITSQISDRTQKYQPHDSAGREAHLHSLVEEGRRIRDTIAQHRGNWSFGPWDEGVRFPSLLKNGILVTSPRH